MIAANDAFLGDDLLPWLLFAVGAAMVVANIAAYVRPPREEPGVADSPRREPPPLGRIVPLVLLGLVVSIWSAASLLR